MTDIKNYNQIFEKANVIITSEDGVDNKNVKKAFDEIRKAFQEQQKGYETLRNENKVLKIGVVGQVKAGKSSFLNSLFFNGENVLPKASTPMTAGLTVLEYGNNNEFAVEYYNAQEWRNFEDLAKEYDDFIENYKEGRPEITDEEAAKEAKIPDDLVSARELVTKCANIARSKVMDKSKVEIQPFTDITDLQNILENFVGANGQFTSVVKSLTIRLNDERLKDLCIVDTPGVNDPVVSREMRTREFLRGCHGVFFLSFSSRFFDSTDVSFLSDRIGSQGISKIVLIASKFDSVLQDVGMKFNDDLGGAISDCERQLKGQFERNFATADYNGEKPIFTESSGIGFSIANKPKDSWDSVEKNVMEQMKRFYPSDFSTEEDIKEAFLALANIDEIRDKYLDGVFVKNRDSIIRNKSNAYFANMSRNIGKVLRDQKEGLEGTLKVLQITDISKMEELRDATLRVVKNIQANVDSLATRSGTNAERFVKECWNSFSVSNRIPMTTESDTFTRKSTFFGRSKNVTASYRIVDGAKLADQMSEELECAGKSLADNWRKKAEQLNNSIMDLVADIIKDAEKNDKGANVDADGLRRMLKEIIDSMSNQSTLNYRDAVEVAKTEIIGIAQNARIGRSFGEMKMSEDVAISEVNRRARDKNEEIRSRVSTAIDNFKDSMKRVLQNSKNEVINVFIDRKKELIDKANSSVRDYLSQLEESLNNKKEQQRIYEDTIANIDKIEKLL